MSFWSKYVNSDRPFQIKLPVFARPEVSSLNFYCGGMTSEAYSDPCQTFTMKRFAKIVDSFQLLHIFTKSAIFDVWQSSKYASGPIYVHSYMFYRLVSRPPVALARSLLPQCGCNELDFIEATGHGQVQCRSFHLCAIQRQKRTIKKLRITNPPFHANIPFLYPLKTPENLFSDVFSGYRNETLAWNGLNWNFRMLTRKI